MNMLVTGASGCIGRVLVASLRRQGHDILGLSRRPAADSSSIACDMTSKSALAAVLARRSFDVVIHAAFVNRLKPIDPEGYAANVATASNLADLAAVMGVRRILFLSSATVYGPGYRVVEQSRERLNPVDWYSRSKVEAEEAFRKVSRKVEVVILRFPAVLDVGKKRGQDLVTDMIDSLTMEGKIIVYGTGRSRRQFVAVEDITEIIMRLAVLKLQDGLLSVPVGSPEIHTINELAHMVAAAAGFGEIVFDRERPDSPDQFIDPAILQRVMAYRFQMGLQNSIQRMLGGTKPHTP